MASMLPPLCLPLLSEDLKRSWRLRRDVGEAGNGRRRPLTELLAGERDIGCHLEARRRFSVYVEGSRGPAKDLRKVLKTQWIGKKS